MKRLLLTTGLCLAAQGALADEGNRPEPRPAMCRIEGSVQLRPCTVVWDAAYRVEAPVVVRRTAEVKVRKIVRLPWTIGAFQ
jgi:hypothetical protein